MATAVQTPLASHETLSDITSHTGKQVCDALAAERNARYATLCSQVDRLGIVKLGLNRELSLGDRGRFKTAGVDLERLKQSQEESQEQYAKTQGALGDLNLLVDYFRRGIEHATRESVPDRTLAAIECYQPKAGVKVKSSKENLDKELLVLRIWERELQNLSFQMNHRIGDLTRFLANHQVLATTGTSPSTTSYLYNYWLSRPAAAKQDLEQKQGAEVVRGPARSKRATFDQTLTLESSLDELRGKSAKEVYEVLKGAYDADYANMAEMMDKLGALNTRLNRHKSLIESGHYDSFANETVFKSLQGQIKEIDRVQTQISKAAEHAEKLESFLKKGIEYLTHPTIRTEDMHTVKLLEPSDAEQLSRLETETQGFLSDLQNKHLDLTVLIGQHKDRMGRRFTPYHACMESYVTQKLEALKSTKVED